MKSKLLTQSGSVLIEALVALVIVAVGTFGVVKLNTVMLSGTGLSKTRAEALQIAVQRMEEVRDYALSTGCTALGIGTIAEANPVAGVNANYTVVKQINVFNDPTDPDPPPPSPGQPQINVKVCVAWDGSSTPCAAAADKRTILKSVVSCVGVGTSGMIGGNATARTANTVKTPTGAAHVGGRANPTCPAGNCVVTINNTNSNPDNTQIYKTGNLVELIDVTDPNNKKVLLTVEDGSDFSTISGRVFIETDSKGDPIVDAGGSTTNIADDKLFVLSSDASYCARIFPTDANSKVPSGATGGGIKYRYFDYNCYVSKGWWGNIGVVRLGTAGANDRVCVGDLAFQNVDPTSIWSKKTQFSISRGYRAYRKVNPSGSDTDQTNFETTGIGFSVDGNNVLQPYAAVHIGGTTGSEHHDFLLATVAGQDTCETSGVMTRITGQFSGNQGKFYCMSAQCPLLTEHATTQTTVVHGTIAVDIAKGAVLTGIDPADCQGTPTFTQSGSNYLYSCTKIWTGFIGSAWQGGVTFTRPAGSTSTICANSTGSVASVLPTGSAVASTVNDTSALVNPNSISFADVALAVTDITINFDAKETIGDCPLGQPSVQWSPDAISTTTMKSLSWSAINLATRYVIQTCTFGSSSNSCSPSGSATTTLLTYTPDATLMSSSVKGICVSITASNSGVNRDSAPSTPRCVKVANPSGYNFN